MSKTPHRRGRVDLAQWPALASFFRGYLHQDAALEHVSLAAAFDAFWNDAADQERQHFLQEWDRLTALLEGKPWGRVRQTVQAMGAAWLPGRQAGYSALQRAVVRHRVP